MPGKLRLDELNVLQACSVILEDLQKRGIETRQRHNLKKYNRVMKQLNGNGVSLEFSRKLGLRPNNFTWLEWRKDGKPIAAFGMRMDNLGDTSLHQIWKNGFQEHIYDSGRAGKQQPQIAKSMRGRVVYLGDYFLKEEYRDGNLSMLQTLLGHFIAETKWKPDWIYAFMAKRLILDNRYSDRVGFFISSPTGSHWENAPHGIRKNDWLVASNRETLAQAAIVIAENGLDDLQTKPTSQTQ